MLSRITWTMLAFGIVLMVIGLMDFTLTALQEPALLKHASRIWPSTSSFDERAARELLRDQ